MFATTAVSAVLGVRPDQIQNKSFYECIRENCLTDAVRCLESAKANDSLAYLRFWYRDPRRQEDFQEDERNNQGSDEREAVNDARIACLADSRLDFAPSAWEGLDGQYTKRSYHSVVHWQTSQQLQANSSRLGDRQLQQQHVLSLELEAVISCTSDGLLVVLRKARPVIPVPHPPLLPFDLETGLFAAPWPQWSTTPPYVPPDASYSFRPPLHPQLLPLRDNVAATDRAHLDQLMKSIRDVAVFAWALVGINENMTADKRGMPATDSQYPSNNRCGLGPTSGRGYSPQALGVTESPTRVTDAAGNGHFPQAKEAALDAVGHSTPGYSDASASRRHLSGWPLLAQSLSNDGLASDDKRRPQSLSQPHEPKSSSHKLTSSMLSGLQSSSTNYTTLTDTCSGEDSRCTE